MKANQNFEEWFIDVHTGLLDYLSGQEIPFDFNCSSPNTQMVETRSKEIETGLLDLYRLGINGFKIDWTIPESTDKDEIRGSINIWPIENLFNEKNSINVESKEIKVNHDLNRKDNFSLKGYFRIVDYFVDEAQVGYFSDPMLKFRLYYVDSDQEFWDIKLDFKGYFELACASKGFEYWQHFILFKLYNKSWHQTGHDNFIETMPEIFPDFKIEEFTSLYDSLKLTEF